MKKKIFLASRTKFLKTGSIFCEGSVDTLLVDSKPWPEQFPVFFYKTKRQKFPKICANDLVLST